MNTSHHPGGAPDVFLSNASDVTRRYLHRLEQSTEGIFYCTANLHNPDLELEDLGRYGSSHETWHRIWVRSSKALVLRAGGANWQQCAEAVGTSTANLREWRKHPDADGFLKEAVRSNLEQAHTLFADAAPRLAERLIALGLDERVKGYTAVSAISECFRILQQGVVDREHRDQLSAIRSTLEQIEGQAPDVIDV